MTNESAAVAALRELVALRAEADEITRLDCVDKKTAARWLNLNKSLERAWAEAKRVVAALSAAVPARPAQSVKDVMRLAERYAAASVDCFRTRNDHNEALVFSRADSLRAAIERLAAAPVSPPESQPNAAMTAALMMLFDAANEIHGTLDEQTYDEKRRADWDLPDDHAFEVTITAAHERALAKAICSVEAASRAHLAAPPAALAVQPLPLLDQSANALGASPCGGPGSAASRPEPQGVSALRAPIPGAWQPIESAPKDGSYILVSHCRGAWIAHWAPVAGSGYRFDRPWRSVMLNHDHIAHTARYLPPTHWMPLPPPARGIDSPEGVETGTGSTAKGQP